MSSSKVASRSLNMRTVKDYFLLLARPIILDIIYLMEDYPQYMLLMLTIQPVSCITSHHYRYFDQHDLIQSYLSLKIAAGKYRIFMLLQFTNLLSSISVSIKSPTRM